MFKYLIPPLFAAAPAFAGDAVITDAKAVKSGDTWRFSVTIAHGDTGWDHYADAWRVVDAAGEVLGTRILHHPHVEEQPFTRSQSGIEIPADVSLIYVRGHELVEGYSSKVVPVDLTTASGDRYEVER